MYTSVCNIHGVNIRKNTKIRAHLPHVLNEVLVSEIFGTDLTLVFLFADISAANGTIKIMPSPTGQPHVLLCHPSLTKTLPNYWLAHYFIVPIFITGNWNNIKMGTVCFLNVC